MFVASADESQPSQIWLNGSIVPWASGSIHFASETALRGLNVFEGIRAYQLANRRGTAIIALDEHMERLRRSLHLLSIGGEHELDSVREGVVKLATEMGAASDLYFRATVYLERGGYEASLARQVVGSYVIAHPVRRGEMESVSLGISDRRRIADSTFPSQAKCGAMYAIFRLARIDGARQGWDRVVMLNEAGHVAEAAGSAVLIAEDGVLISPRFNDGGLESITRSILQQLCEEELDIPYRRDSISRARIGTADEVLLCGTLDEVERATSLGDVRLRGGDIAPRLWEAYRRACTTDLGERWQTRVWG